MQYCSLQHWTFLLSPVPSTTGYCFCFGSIPFILSGIIYPLISSSILGTYRPGEFIFQCPIFLPFPTVHGVLKARILKWLAIPFSSGPHSVWLDSVPLYTCTFIHSCVDGHLSCSISWLPYLGNEHKGTYISSD